MPRRLVFFAPWLAMFGALLAGAGIVFAGNDNKFIADLSGDEEVPVRVTGASGIATFKLNRDGDELKFKLQVDDIENVVQAHIHVEAPGANGPIAVFLYGPVAPAGGPIDGNIGRGVITPNDLIGPLEGMTLADLIAEMESGNTYVNVHTSDGAEPPNTGAGDFPGGEIRGQIDFR